MAHTYKTVWVQTISNYLQLTLTQDHSLARQRMIHTPRSAEKKNLFLIWMALLSYYTPLLSSEP